MTHEAAGNPLYAPLSTHMRYVGALDPSEVEVTSPHDFSYRFSEAMKGSPYIHHVNHYSPDEIASSHMKPLTSNAGKTGLLVHDHGDGRVEATGLYNRSKVPGAGVDLLTHAMTHHGVNYVECFGPRLPQIYRKAGFVTREKLPFDPEQAPPGWNHKDFDHPSYHLMTPRKAPKTAMTLSRADLDHPWDDLDALRSQVEAEIASEPLDDHARWESGDPKRADRDWLGALFLSGELTDDEYQQMLAECWGDTAASDTDSDIG